MTNSIVVCLPDDSDLAEEIQGKGSKSGYAVILAHSSAEALKVAEDTPLYFAVLDLSIPLLSGLETGRILWSETSTPFIIEADVLCHSTVEAASRAGAHACLAKTGGAEQALATIACAHQGNGDSHTPGLGWANVIHSNRTISAAVGILMERLGLPYQEAFNRLRSQARAQSRRLETVAAEFLGDTDEAS